MSSRRQGLSYGAPPKPLLRTIGGRPRMMKKMEDIDDASSTSSSTATSERSLKRSAEAAASENDSLDARPSFKHMHGSDSEDTDEERRSRATISRTNFGPSSSAKSNQDLKKGSRAASKGTAAEKENDRVPPKRRKVGKDSESPKSSPKMKAPSSSQRSQASEPTSSAGSHLSQSNGFTRSHKGAQTYKSSSLARKFGARVPSDSKADSHTATSKSQSSQEDKGSKKSAKFRTHDDLRSSPVPQPPTKFKSYGDEDLFSPSPERTSFITPSQLDLLDSEGESTSVSKPTFKLFSESQDEGSDPDEPMASFPSVDSGANSSSRAGEGPDRVVPVVPRTAVCPWCGDPVDEALHKEFSKNKRMNVQQQSRFCRRHKKQTALDTWREKSYPSIDWDEMPDRVAAHHGFLSGIVNGRPSYYRNKLAKQVESGESRTLRKEENLNPGYYGPRGFNLMCDLLVQRFTGLLKTRAMHDPVIAGRGSAAFVQCVLVAELAVQLIMGDMDVSAEEARVIMEDSKALGELVHDD